MRTSDLLYPQDVADQPPAGALRGIPDDEVALGLSLDRWPLPPTELREGCFGPRHHDYWRSGLADYLRARPADQPERVLEIGSSSGRVIRHFAYREGSECFACDINPKTIAWMNDHLPVKGFCNSPQPHLPLPDKSVDLTLAFSVFTHIDTFELAWLLELSRVTRGEIFVTVGMEHAWAATMRDDWRYESSRKFSAEFAKLERGSEMAGERVFFPYVSDTSYGNTFHKEAYIRRVWGRFFDVEILPPTGASVQHGVRLRAS